MGLPSRRNALRALGGACCTAFANAAARSTVVFQSGEDGYHTFRIPALLRTRKNTLLAFCEGRRNSSGDSGDIDLVLKRSVDNGVTWSRVAVVADMGPNTVGNPCPVQDRSTGRILLPLTYNPGGVTERQIVDRTVDARRSVFLTYSDDDGATWAEPRDITSAVRRPDWTWYATGPGAGIQMSSGRLIIPCDHIEEGSKAFHSHAIFSDDGGDSWRIGGRAAAGTNECQVVELRRRILMLNMRSYHKKNRRAVARSTDGGLTWSDLEWDAELIEPVCQASLIRVDNALYFSNPASTKREKMTVRRSNDEGRTWTVLQELHAGPAAYSCLAPLSRRELGCLYECGESSPYERIVFTAFPRR